MAAPLSLYALKKLYHHLFVIGLECRSEVGSRLFRRLFLQFNVGNGLCAVPRFLPKPDGNGTQAVPYDP